MKKMDDEKKEKILEEKMVVVEKKKKEKEDSDLTLPQKPEPNIKGIIGPYYSFYIWLWFLRKC